MAHGTASNFIRQTVGSAVGTTDPETIDVADASAFPDPSTAEYDIVIWDAGTHNRPDLDADAEVMTVTGRDTTAETLTCARGKQGTSNTSHPDTSDVIIAPLSVGDFNGVRSQTVTAGKANITNVGAVIYKTSNQTISNQTQTKVTFESAEVDPSDVLNVDLTNNKIVVQEDGYYIISGVAEWETDAGWSTGDPARVNIRVNGTVVGRKLTAKVGTSGEQKGFSYQSDLSTNDEIELYAFQDTGADKALGSGQDRTRLEVGRLG